MKTHFFEEHPFLICSEHQTKPIHKFSCFVPQNNPHFVNRLNYYERLPYLAVRVLILSTLDTSLSAEYMY